MRRMRVSLFDFMLLVNFQIETTQRVATMANRGKYTRGVNWSLET